MGDRTLSLSLDTLNDLAETENKKATVQYNDLEMKTILNKEVIADLQQAGTKVGPPNHHFVFLAPVPLGLE